MGWRLLDESTNNGGVDWLEIAQLHCLLRLLVRVGGTPLQCYCLLGQ